MKISVTPGDVQVASVEVRRHSGGIYTVQIRTPYDKNVGIGFGTIAEPGRPVSYKTLLHSCRHDDWRNSEYLPPTTVSLTPDSNDEEEALFNGLFDVLDDWSRYSVTLIAIPASVLEEAEEAGSWEPQGPIDYLAT